MRLLNGARWSWWQEKQVSGSQAVFNIFGWFWWTLWQLVQPTPIDSCWLPVQCFCFGLSLWQVPQTWDAASPFSLPGLMMSAGFSDFACVAPGPWQPSQPPPVMSKNSAFEWTVCLKLAVSSRWHLRQVLSPTMPSSLVAALAVDNSPPSSAMAVRYLIIRTEVSLEIRACSVSDCYWPDMRNFHGC